MTEETITKEELNELMTAACQNAMPTREELKEMFKEACTEAIRAQVKPNCLTPALKTGDEETGKSTNGKANAVVRSLRWFWRYINE